MSMLKNTQTPLKIQIQDLNAEQSDASKISELTSEELNLVAGGYSFGASNPSGSGNQCIDSAHDMHW
jgi:hypothetical protein